MIEGWRDRSFDDPTIHQLLGLGSHAELLRRYRNAIYHYQPTLIEPRPVAFLAEAEEAVPWTDTLHHEFCRFFDEMLASIPGQSNRRRLRESVIALIGWLPMDDTAAQYAKVRRLCDDAEARIDRSGEVLPPEARALLESVAEARAIAEDGIAKYPSRKVHNYQKRIGL